MEFDNENKNEEAEEVKEEKKEDELEFDPYRFGKPEIEPEPEPEQEPEPEPINTPEPDYSRQQYTPPQYRNTYYQNNDEKNNSDKKAVIVLCSICIVCVLLIAGIVGMMMYKNWKLPVQDDGENTENTENTNIIDNTENDKTDTEKTDNADIEDKAEDVFSETNEKDDSEIKNESNTDKVDITIKPTPKEKLSYTDIYKKCAPASVGIMVTVPQSTYFGNYTVPAVGSGFIVGKTGYIVTNAHVVVDAITIKVYLPDGNEFDADLVGCDKISDIAVIKIEAGYELPTVEFGDSSKLQVGDEVAAIGTPASITLAGTFTHGIISAVEREIEKTDDNGLTKKMKLLQTDATINPGNSGGPLLNMNGQVIGINTLKITEEFEGIGFAIPSVYAEKIVERIISSNGNTSFDPDNGFVTVDEKPQMGISKCMEINAYTAMINGVPQGVQVILLASGCSLEKNGMLVGDIITKFNGVEIRCYDDLVAERDKVKPREKATLTVYRNKEYIDINFEMGSNIDY